MIVLKIRGTLASFVVLIAVFSGTVSFALEPGQVDIGAVHFMEVDARIEKIWFSDTEKNIHAEMLVQVDPEKLMAVSGYPALEDPFLARASEFNLSDIPHKQWYHGRSFVTQLKNILDARPADLAMKLLAWTQRQPGVNLAPAPAQKPANLPNYDPKKSVYFHFENGGEIRLRLAEIIWINESGAGGDLAWLKTWYSHRSFVVVDVIP